MKIHPIVFFILSASALAMACSDSKPTPAATSTAPAPPTVRGGAASAAAVASATVADAGVKVAEEYSENDFVENDRNRDPFRSFAAVAAPTKAPATNQIVGILGDYSVDELKLNAIVMSSAGPLAMIVDPTHKGWTVKKGDYVGRAETVHTGGQNGADYFLTWRVDRIREGDIVFIREDRANPAVPPATRVVSLHQESDKDRIRLN
jgi:type IV pilus assembly protein PilP